MATPKIAPQVEAPQVTDAELAEMVAKALAADTTTETGFTVTTQTHLEVRDNTDGDMTPEAEIETTVEELREGITVITRGSVVEA